MAFCFIVVVQALQHNNKQPRYMSEITNFLGSTAGQRAVFLWLSLPHIQHATYLLVRVHLCQCYKPHQKYWAMVSHSPSTTNTMAKYDGRLPRVVFHFLNHPILGIMIGRSVAATGLFVKQWQCSYALFIEYLLKYIPVQLLAFFIQNQLCISWLKSQSTVSNNEGTALSAMSLLNLNIHSCCVVTENTLHDCTEIINNSFKVICTLSIRSLYFWKLPKEMYTSDIQAHTIWSKSNFVHIISCVWLLFHFSISDLASRKTNVAKVSMVTLLGLRTVFLFSMVPNPSFGCLPIH